MEKYIHIHVTESSPMTATVVIKRNAEMEEWVKKETASFLKRFFQELFPGLFRKGGKSR